MVNFTKYCPCKYLLQNYKEYFICYVSVTQLNVNWHKHTSIFIKPGTRGRRLCIWFLEIALVRASVCVCVFVCLSVCVSAPKSINNQWHDWCDIGCVRLVKQVSRLFPAFNYFI